MRELLAKLLREVVRLAQEVEQIQRRMSDIWQPRPPEGGGGDGGGDTIQVNVIVTNPDGAGNAVIPTSFRYDCYTKDGTLLGSNVPLTGKGNRLFLLTATAANNGSGYIDASGTFILTWCDETYLQTDDCENAV